MKKMKMKKMTTTKAINKINETILTLINIGFFYQPFNGTYRKTLRGINCVEVVELETEKDEIDKGNIIHKAYIRHIRECVSQEVINEMQLAFNQLKEDMEKVGYKME